MLFNEKDELTPLAIELEKIFLSKGVAAVVLKAEAIGLSMRELGALLHNSIEYIINTEIIALNIIKDKNLKEQSESKPDTSNSGN